jgi:hypothetical protein
MRNEGVAGPSQRTSQWIALDEAAPAPRPSGPLRPRHVPAWDDILERPRVRPGTPARAADPARGLLGAQERLLQLHARRDPGHVVEATLSRARLLIGRDAIELTVRTLRDGRIHLLQAGSDGSLGLLFPNAMDGDNVFEAGREACLPRPGWRMLAGGPRGHSRLLVLVTTVECELHALAGARPGPLVHPFSGPEGRERLFAWVDRCVAGEGVQAFGSALLDLDEQPATH